MGGKNLRWAPGDSVDSYSVQAAGLWAEKAGFKNSQITTSRFPDAPAISTEIHATMWHLEIWPLKAADDEHDSGFLKSSANVAFLCYMYLALPPQTKTPFIKTHMKYSRIEPSAVCNLNNCIVKWQTNYSLPLSKIHEHSVSQGPLQDATWQHREEIFHPSLST